MYGKGRPLVLGVYNPKIYEEYNPILTLVSSPVADNLHLNDKFENIAIQMGFNVIRVSLLENEFSVNTNEISNTINGINDTITAAGIYPNIINLKVSIKDLHSDYNTYLRLLDSNLLCATDCEDNNLTYTRLISDTILNYDRLLQVIESEDLELNDYVQICLPRNSPNFPTLSLNQNMNWQVIIHQGDCAADAEADKFTLAMITNEPPNTDSLLPIIFYQTQYNLPEVKDRFPNSLSLSTTWQPLKYAFREFLKHMAWYRVAVLSDDSTYSQNFLKELVPVLTKEGITVTDQNCIGRFCDFTKAINLLKTSDAKIIILNIDKVNAKNLVDTINYNNEMRDVTYIVRDWPFANLGKVMSDIFSITLSPVFDEEYKFYPYLSSIKEGIQIIDRIYRNVMGNREMFQRAFANAVASPRDFKTNAYISRMHVNSDPTLVAGMTIEGESTKVFYFTDRLYQGRIPRDTTRNCITRSRNFFKPCSHEELLLLVCVCVMFALSLLVVIVCFNKYRNSRFYNRFS